MHDEITIRCQFCKRLFLMRRGIWIQTTTACPACFEEARRNTEEMEREAGKAGEE